MAQPFKSQLFHRLLRTVDTNLNNKLSTLGIAFAAIRNTDIQVCYAPADTYNSEDYSEPGNKCYVVDITSHLHP